MLSPSAEEARPRHWELGGAGRVEVGRMKVRKQPQGREGRGTHGSPCLRPCVTPDLLGIRRREDIRALLGDTQGLHRSRFRLSSLSSQLRNLRQM